MIVENESYTDSDHRSNRYDDKFYTLPRSTSCHNNNNNRHLQPPPPSNQYQLNHENDKLTDLRVITCLLPNGIITDVTVHPDDEISTIKQQVLYKANNRW